MVNIRARRTAVKAVARHPQRIARLKAFVTPTIQTTVTVLDASTVQTSGGTVYTGVYSYTDASGVTRFLADLVSGVVDGTDPVTGKATPTTATPQVEVIVTNSDTEELVYRASTSGNRRESSSLKGNISVSMQKVAGSADQYEIVITYGTAETRAYIYTLVNEWGEEGVPSPAAICDVTALQTVSVEGIVLPAAPLSD